MTSESVPNLNGVESFFPQCTGQPFCESYPASLYQETCCCDTPSPGCGALYFECCAAPGCSDAIRPPPVECVPEPGLALSFAVALVVLGVLKRWRGWA